jgi:hypothetical protein
MARALTIPSGGRLEFPNDLNDPGGLRAAELTMLHAGLSNGLFFATLGRLGLN